MNGVTERRNVGEPGLRFVGGMCWSRVVTALIGRLITSVAVFVILLSSGAQSLNVEGNALLDFMNGVTSHRDIYTFQSWNSADATPCAWFGIRCVQIPGNTDDQRVVDITLTSNELEGTISPRLGDLGYLRTVDLSTNNLTGQIPTELFKVLSLNRLDLSNNNLTGYIPEEIRYCYGLQKLRLSSNSIAGALPIGIGSNLTQLEQLDLSTNRFTGTIPDDFGKLTTLHETLNLSNNRLSGVIPESLANLGDVFIDLSNNNLSGPIPPDPYLQSLGAAAFAGNPALCGAPLKTNCGPSPAPSSTGSTATGRSGERHDALSRGAIIGVAVACGALGLLVAALFLYVRARKRIRTFSRLDTGLRGFLCASGTGEEDEYEGKGELVHLTGSLSFTLEELLRASAFVLGKSSVGIVYKAVLDDGTVVAVRRLGLAGGDQQRRKVFQTEVKAIAQVRHPNIVCLHSYSWKADEKLLICEYLPNGSLEAALHSGRSEGWKGPLPWEARIRIARGVAKGIAHIHNCNPRKQYAHGDINPGNILLDAFLEPRVADFGLQQLLALAQPAPVPEFGSTRGDSGTQISVAQLRTEIGRGSDSGGLRGGLMGVYRAPETVTTTGVLRPSQKGDVFAFGVMVLDLLTGRSPFTQLGARGPGGGDQDLMAWMRVALQEKRALSEILDPHLTSTNKEQQIIHQMVETLQVALACIAVSAESRPNMKQIAEFFELQASNL